MDSGRSSAKTTGVNPATGRKEGGSGPLFRDLTEPSYTQMSSPRVIKAMINTRGCGEAKSHSATTVDSYLDETCKTIHNNIPTIRTDKPQKVRSLTLPETLVLQGFPSDFSMEAAKTQRSRWTMIGNAVCPPVAEAVIRGIRND